jgi:hypothetical protein
MSLPGVSRHLRMRDVCCRTATKASSSRRAWSSGGGADEAMVELRPRQRGSFGYRGWAEGSA